MMILWDYNPGATTKGYHGIKFGLDEIDKLINLFRSLSMNHNEEVVLESKQVKAAYEFLIELELLREKTK